MLLGEISSELHVKKEDDEKGKKIEGMFDFYFLFGKGKPARIASIQKNNPTALDGKTPVKLLTKEDLDKALVLGKPHFVFNISKFLVLNHTPFFNPLQHVL